MPDDTFGKIEQAFNAAVGEREAGRTPAITVLSGGDPKIAAEVRALLAFVEGEPGEPAGPFLDPHELHATRVENAAVRDSLRDELDVTAASQRVGEFELIAPLGTGGTGVAFVAQQRQPKRRVALRLIRRTAVTVDDVAQVERAARRVARLRHAGIGEVYEAGVAELHGDAGPVRVLYLASEFVEGATLLDHVTRLPANTHGRRTAAIELIAQAADTMHHAHQRGVIHRNLKPSNVLVVTAAGGATRVKIVDFDLTGRPALGDSAAATLAYLGPEQVRGAEAADVRTDEYALGVMFYQLLCYRLPILVDGCPLPEAVRRITDVTPPRPSTFERHVRGDLESVVVRAIEKDVDRRYPSCADVARDLRRTLASVPIEVRQDAMIHALRRRVRIYRGLAWLGALVAVVAIVLAVAALRHRP